MDLRVILETAAAAGAGPTPALPLVSGRVLSARVVAIQDGQVLLDLAGELQPARSLVPLAVGDMLKVQVVRPNGGEVWLKVLGGEGKALPGNRLAEELRSMGIPPGEASLQAAQGLIVAGQPVTAGRVRAVLAALRRDPGAPDQTAKAAALLLGRRLPPLEPLLAALRFYAQGAPPFADLANALEEALSALPEEPAGQSGTGNSPLPGWVGKLRGLLMDLTLPGTEPAGNAHPHAAPPLPPGAESLANRLGEAVRALGMDYEREWVRQWVGRPESGGAASTPPTGGELALPAGLAGTRPGLKETLLAIRHLLGAVVGGPDPAKVEGHPAHKAYVRALARTEEALQTLTAWQVLSGQPEDGVAPERQTMVFQLPIAFGGGLGTLDVVVEKPPREKGDDGADHDGGDRDEGESSRFAVSLRLAPPHLGDLRVDLFLQEQRLALGFAAREAPSLVALEEGGEVLGERLRRRGFVVEGINFRPLPSDEGAGAGEAPGASPAAGIDLVI